MHSCISENKGLQDLSLIGFDVKLLSASEAITLFLMEKKNMTMDRKIFNISSDPTWSDKQTLQGNYHRAEFPNLLNHSTHSLLKMSKWRSIS